MKLKVSVKTDYEFEIRKKEIFVNGMKSNLSWKTEKTNDDDYKTTLVCYEHNNWNDTSEISWLPTQNMNEYFSFNHREKNPSLQFLGYWTMRCLKNVNNYSTNHWG
jgi:hypothetical protein